MSALYTTFLTVSIGGGSDFFFGGPFHAQCKIIENIKKDDLDLFYVYFSSIMSYEYPFIEKLPKTNQK